MAEQIRVKHILQKHLGSRNPNDSYRKKPVTRTKEEAEKHLESRKKACVMNRAGRPEDTANAVLFFASDESSFVSGQLLCVDGGRVDRM